TKRGAELDETGVRRQREPCRQVAAGGIELGEEDLAVARPHACDGQTARGCAVRTLDADPRDEAHGADCRTRVTRLAAPAPAMAGASASSTRIDTDVLSLLRDDPSTENTVARRTRTAPCGLLLFEPDGAPLGSASWAAAPVATTSTWSPALRLEVGTWPGFSERPMTTLPLV